MPFVLPEHDGVYKVHDMQKALTASVDADEQLVDVLVSRAYQKYFASQSSIVDSKIDTAEKDYP